MSLIEQATKRLDELSRAGIVLPWGSGDRQGDDTGRVEDAALGTNGAEADLLVAAAARRMEHLRIATDAAGAHAPAQPQRNRRTATAVELDFAKLGAAGYLVPEQPRSPLADQFRQVKRSLLKNIHVLGQPPLSRSNIIMVTSALKGEGKTFCAINLAMSIAMELDRSALLVDADVLRPAVLGRLGLSTREGLLDVLSEPGRDLSTVLLKTNLPKLGLLPAGTAKLNSTELLTSDAMGRLLDELATTYSDRVVILDAPPLLLTTESQALATRVGQILMIVEASRTSPGAVAQAFEAVEQCPAVMSLLNKCEASSATYGYGYYD